MLIGREVESARLATALASAGRRRRGIRARAASRASARRRLLRGLVDQAGADDRSRDGRGRVRGRSSVRSADRRAAARPAPTRRTPGGAGRRAVDRTRARSARGRRSLRRRGCDARALLRRLPRTARADRRRRSAVGRFASRDALVRGAASHPVSPPSSLPPNGPGAPPFRGLHVVPVGPLDREDAARVLAENERKDCAGGAGERSSREPACAVELPHLLTPGQLAGTEALANPIPTANGLERAFTARLAHLSAGGGCGDRGRRGGQFRHRRCRARHVPRAGDR